MDDVQLEPEQVEDEPLGFEGIIGRHPSMEAIFEVIRRVAPTDATVLITGGSGTGKELVAAALHRLSTRAAGRFVPVHCGAIPEELLESEMFGHERGAFTGAVASRLGRFKLADHGTIFLDEIGEMSPKLQVKLLRVLEDGRFEPVGSVVTQQVDVRIIAATNRALDVAVAAKQFREDLFYRQMEAIEDRIIAQALRLSGGNKKEAARLLRVNRTTLLEKLKRKRAQGGALAALLGAPPRPECDAAVA